jgi:hypothetical protein
MTIIVCGLVAACRLKTDALVLDNNQGNGPEHFLALIVSIA